MGNKLLQVKLPTNYSDDDIRSLIKQRFGFSDFSYQIDKKSLDARKKKDIHWLVSLVVSSEKFANNEFKQTSPLSILSLKSKKTAIVIGSGPAGFFAAHVLQQAGIQVSIIERGSDVEKRTIAINQLDRFGEFAAQNNYAFGEGGAGTFSDGKLTSRSKHISAERNFILAEYVKAGAPEEILYLAHPHLGTDVLKTVVKNLRVRFIENGGEFLFDTMLQDIQVRGNRVEGVFCNKAELSADYIVLATGHSAYETYRMLIRRGVSMHTKNFAIGHRIEHKQSLINQSQWGRDQLPGVKAAEYRLHTKSKLGLPVYTFCMCPGGVVVPAAAYENKSLVNGMSYYKRDGLFANAACVAGVHPDMLLGRSSTALEILDWMDDLEGKFYDYANSLIVPAVNASDYMKQRASKSIPPGSYPLGMEAAPLYHMVPSIISKALMDGLIDFNNKLKGFDQGVLMGLESKTSSPIQVAREKDGRCIGFENLYFVGEGSGYAGGIVSSAADGVKCAMAIIHSH